MTFHFLSLKREIEIPQFPESPIRGFQIPRFLSRVAKLVSLCDAGTIWPYISYIIYENIRLKNSHLWSHKTSTETRANGRDLHIMRFPK
jgi:hypothetical protein